MYEHIWSLYIKQIDLTENTHSKRKVGAVRSESRGFHGSEDVYYGFISCDVV
jgi:hypothetical protein